MGWEARIAGTEEKRNVYTFLVENSKENTLLRITTSRFVDNIKLHSKTNKCVKVFSTNYFPLAQNVSKGPILVNSAMNFLGP